LLGKLPFKTFKHPLLIFSKSLEWPSDINLWNSLTRKCNFSKFWQFYKYTHTYTHTHTHSIYTFLVYALHTSDNKTNNHEFSTNSTATHSLKFWKTILIDLHEPQGQQSHHSNGNLHSDNFFNYKCNIY
jgi:hypothetical protein